MDYEIIKYRPEFRDQVLTLQSHLWGADPEVNAAYLAWKHEDNPYVDSPLIYLALSGTDVVGMRAFFGARWEAGAPGQIFTGVCGGDMVVAPEHRKRGLFRLINAAAMDDLAETDHEYVLNFSAAPITFHASLRTGWQTAGPYRMVRRLAREPSAELRMRVRQAAGYLSAAETPRPRDMADLIDRLPRDGRLRHVRDEAYLSWRYRNPRSRYGFLFWDDGGLEGYMALQLRRGGAVLIVDWEGTRPRVRGDLLRAAIRRCYRGPLLIWSATLDADATRQLQTTGFRPMDESQGIKNYHPGVLVRATSDDKPAADWAVRGRRLLNLADWDLRMIYSDAF